jgi:hypothetical protein
MPVTYSLISDTTLGSATSSVNLTSISQSYTHLRISVYVPSYSVSGNAFRMRFNGDTASNYFMYGWAQTNANAPTSDWSLPTTHINLGVNSVTSDTAYPTTWLIDMLNYTTSQPRIHYQVAQSQTNSSGYVGRAVCRYTTSISSINFYQDTAQFAVGSRFTIYGILKA